MKFLVIPLTELKEIDPEWEWRRKSNDGTKAIIHKEIYDTLVPQAVAIPELGEETVEPTYPYPLVEGDELDTMEDFKYIEPSEEPVNELRK